MNHYRSSDEEGPATDAALVLKASSGDTQAFEQLVMRHQGLACAVAYAACGDFHRSEEIAQEAFLSSWRHLSQLKEPQDFRPWLCGIVRNQAASHRRKDQGREQVRRRLEAMPEGEIDPAPSPVDQVASADEVALVLRQLRQLPEAYREPMVLYYRSGESVERVAEMLNISADVVRQRLVRGRALLTERLERLLGVALSRSGPGSGFASGAVGLLGVGRATTATGAGASAKIGGSSLFSSVLGMIAGSFLGMWMLFRGARQASFSRQDERLVRSMLLWQMVILAALGPLIVIGLSKATGNSTPFGFAAGLLCISCVWLVVMRVTKLRERRLKAEGYDGAVASKVWRFDYGQAGFWPAVIGYVVALGSVSNVILIFSLGEIGPQIRMAILWVPVALAVIAVLLLWVRPRHFRRILLSFHALLLLQYLAWVWMFWSAWREEGSLERRSLLMGVHAFDAGIFLGAWIGVWLWWRSEGLGGHEQGLPPSS